MRNYPEDKYDNDNLAELNAAPWQVELLRMNPDYCCWGNFEDYMPGKDKGWAESHTSPDWSGHYELDDYNEVVNFYFEIYRKNHACHYCDQTGLNPASKRISDTFYDFEETGQRWCDKITEDEVYALVKGGRLQDFMPDKKWYNFQKETNNWRVLDRSGENAQWVDCPEPTEMPSVSKVNEANNRYSSRKGFSSHDAINRSILITTRCERLGVYGDCQHCEGNGYIYDEPTARTALQLWVLHPRKGCSKGVYIENIEQSELPQVYAYLRQAADRNAERFSRITPQ